MFKATHGRLTPGMALRIFADTMMVQCSLLAALSLSWVFHVLRGDMEPDKALADQFFGMIGKWADTGWPLALICIAIFYLSGFYTYGRFYQGRYKALIIFQAVSQSYLVFGFVNYGFLGGGQHAADFRANHVVGHQCGTADRRPILVASMDKNCRPGARAPPRRRTKSRSPYSGDWRGGIHRFGAVAQAAR